MDAKRLEELAELAESESKYFTYRGPCKEEDLRDLARCAKALAKVERLLQQWPIVEIRNTGKKRVVESGNRVRSYADTLIAAVEAAPEVKP